MKLKKSRVRIWEFAVQGNHQGQWGSSREDTDVPELDKPLHRLGLIGPTWPFRGGIAHHTTFLAKALKSQCDLRFISFSRMYPKWLYPGMSDKEPGQCPPPHRLDEPLLDSMDPISWWKVGQKLAAWQPDAVVIPWWVAFWAPQYFTIATCLRHANVPVIFFCHNVCEHENAHWKSAATWQVLRLGKAFLCHSEDELDTLQRKVPGRIYRKVHHPTYGDLSMPEDNSKRDHNSSPELLFFGFIRKYKGLDVLLEAMPEIHNRTGARLRVVGEMWGDAAAIRSQIAKLGVDRAVDLDLRYVSNEELPEVFARATLLVLPYRTATGCGPLQLAFGAGLPVVGSAVGSIAEAVQDGDNGLLVPPGDPKALAAAVIRALEPDLTAKLVSGAKKASSAFSWTTLIETVKNVVDEVRGREI